ncbi:methyl-accepting chemotaxis protein [Vibrio tapetis]|uniref:Putative methyl-accepting chemotaxis protein n=1 Tax=Vibrio tapetis subsp. tapetis TaxID=1671868 RepID=A0A2N8Z8G4_9VIBR|nr:methyl-accepting chemotaxis protein [Vibrio tapetis]SON48182.1 putative methyl-accepting chemotaxis protein [Vibrio tapetis subsp. tapetis]
MASLTFRPWERIITDIKLVPKMVMLMVFSSLLIIGKQLWDANTFYDSLILVQKDQVMEVSNAQANFFNNVIRENNEQGKVLVERSMSSQSQSNSSQYTYLVERDTGKVIGHPRAQSMTDLSIQTDAGSRLSDLLGKVQQQGLGYELTGGERFEYAKQIDGVNWLVVTSQGTDTALDIYNDYLVQMVWQTIAMIVIFIVILLGAAKVMLRQTLYIAESIQNLANKDLSETIDMDCKDEYGDLARELEKTRRQLHDVIATQVASSQELFSLTEIMTISMSETKDSAQEEFSEIDQLATAMSEMTTTVQTVADHAQSASSVTESASEQAEKGQRFVMDSVGKMNELSSDISQSAQAVNEVEERVDAIGSVVGTIQGISEQTNLLALNAAIEAARAGEAGRGFAVVADEVRNLAQRTQQATVEIQDMISQLQSSANSAVELMEKSVVEAADGVELVTNAGAELGGIVAQVTQINEMNFQIATAAGQQSTVAEEMNQNLTNVRELVEASVVVVTELLETSEMMESNAAELDTKIQSFKV